MSAAQHMPLARLVRRALHSNMRRVRTVVLGVMMSTLLILVLSATYRSVSLGIIAYTGQSKIDLWVAPLGTDNLVRSSAVLRHSLVNELKSIEGIQAAAPIIRSFVNAESVDGLRRTTLLALGYLGPDGLGGPPAFHSGHAPQDFWDIALDRAAAFRLKVDVGDRLIVNGQSMAVVGLTRRTNLMATQFAFMNATHAEMSSGFRDRVSFVAISLLDDADESAVIRAIEKRPGLRAYRRAVWVENNLQEVAAGFLPMMVLVTTVGLIAAIVLVVLLVQSVVEDRRSEIAVLLAMGVPYTIISRGVIGQVARLVAVGSLFGGLCSVVLSLSVEKWVPTVEMQTSVTDIAASIFALSVISVLAAIVPTLQLRQIDPVEAFRP